MGLVTVFDPSGKEFQKEYIDAQECIQYCGFTLEAPVIVDEPVIAPVVQVKEVIVKDKKVEK